MARIFFPGAPIRIAQVPAGASAPAGGAPASAPVAQAHPK